MIVWNNALISTVGGSTMAAIRDDFSWWGRMVENAVGAHLMSSLRGLPHTLYYWRERLETRPQEES